MWRVLLIGTLGRRHLPWSPPGILKVYGITMRSLRKKPQDAARHFGTSKPHDLKVTLFHAFRMCRSNAGESPSPSARKALARARPPSWTRCAGKWRGACSCGTSGSWRSPVASRGAPNESDRPENPQALGALGFQHCPASIGAASVLQGSKGNLLCHCVVQFVREANGRS